MIELNEQCAGRLKEKLEPILEGVRVKSGSFIDFPEMTSLLALDKVLPERGAEAEKVRNYIGENAIFTFVVSELVEFVGNEFEYDEDKEPFSLTKTDKFPDSSTLASYLIDRFSSLPYEYCITVPISNDVFDYLGEYYPVFPGMRLYDYADQFTERFPERRKVGLLGRALMGDSNFSVWDENAKLVQYQFEGYCSGVLDTSSSESALSKIKSFLGILLAHNLVELSTGNSVPKEVSVDISTRAGNSAWKRLRSKALEHDWSSAMVRMSDRDWIKGLEDDQTRAKVFEAALRNYTKCSIGGGQVERIELASEWLFDSYKSKDDLLSVVHAVVAIEILLGDKKSTDVVGINKLISNRCAYLIGDSANNRADIIKEFGEIYDLRSAIVHRGHRKMSSEERSLLMKLRYLVGRVICKELQLLSND